MLESVRRFYALLWVQGETVLEKIDEVVEILGLAFTHPNRHSQKAGSEITGRLDNRKCAYGCL